MPGLRLDRNDIAATVAHGATVIGWGTVVDARSGDRGAAAMVSEHERLHVSLNQASAFGMLLRAWATHRPDHLGDVIEMCRTTHEVYATYLSVWIGDGDPQSVLEDYPDYVGYFEQGQRLAREFAGGSVAARAAVSAACQAAMQPQLSDAATQLQEGRLLVPENSRPDNRLALLVDAEPRLGHLAEPFPIAWSRGSIGATIERESTRDSGESLRADAKRLTRSMYEAFAEVLGSAGFGCLPWQEDGALDPEVLALGLLGERGGLPPSLDLGGTSSDAPRNPFLLNLQASDGERWVQHEGGRAYVAHLADIPESAEENEPQLGHFVARVPEASHVFVVARPLGLLLEQYEISERAQRLLRAAATDGVITAVRHVGFDEEGGRVTILGILSSASQLDLLRSLDTDLGLLADITMAGLVSVDWMGYWLHSLRPDEVVLGCDIPLSHWLEAAEAEPTPPRLRFVCFEAIPETGSAPTEVLAVEYEDAAGKADRRQLILGGPIAVSSLASALAESPRVVARHDRELVSGSKPLKAVVSRLVEEEPWFERRGHEYMNAVRAK
jgi:hypothetical protein